MEQINQVAIRNQNLKGAYREICSNEEVSRASAARKLSLSRASLSSLVDELIEDGLIKETGKKGGTGAGRNPVMLAPKAGTTFMASILWMNGRVEGRIIDVSTGRDWEKKESDCLVLPVDDAADFAIRSLECAKQLEQLLSPGKRILGTVMIVPGIVDPVRKEILSHPLGISEEIGKVIIRELLENHAEENICLVNDTAILAYGEQISQEWENANFLYINFAVGIGSVVYMHGKPLEDATGRHTQFGHMVMNPNGPLCKCGARGCLETMVGEEAILRRWGLLFRDCGDMKLGEGNYYRVLREKAEQKDVEAVVAMDEIINTFSRALANVVTVVFPEKVIIGGSGYELGEYFLEQIQKKVRETGFSYMVRDLDISYSKRDNDIIYMAGADYTFNTYYDFAQKSIGGLHLG